jgi:pimeloyl-ACP methyl ester carboxylesterase
MSFFPVRCCARTAPAYTPKSFFCTEAVPKPDGGTPFFFADRFARSGIAALVFDKRGAGQSTGDWKTITYKGLADDYLAAVRFLQAQSGVNPKQVGIFGHSQGGTISPLIAARPGVVAFVIAAAAIGTGPIYTQDLYRTRNDLEDRGFTEPEISPRPGNLWVSLGREESLKLHQPLSIRAVQ